MLARCCPPGRHVRVGSSHGGAFTCGEPLTILISHPEVSTLWWWYQHSKTPLLMSVFWLVFQGITW